MKKIKIVTILLLTILLVGCNLNKESSHISSSSTSSSTTSSVNYRSDVKEDVPQVLLDELKGGFDFFYETANSDINSAGYGLIPDRYNAVFDRVGAVASIASVGYGLSIIPIGVEYNWISYEAAKERVTRTLVTLSSMQRTHGFYYHFVDMKSTKRVWNSEVSIIDTAILMNGVLTAGKYFGGDIEKVANQLYEQVEWNWYYDENSLKFYMSYLPESGFSGSWTGYAEQLMIYVLAAGSPQYSVDKEAYTYMTLISKKSDKTDEYDPFYLTYTGSLFTYQFSHAWIDFRDIEDEKGNNWFINSVNASKAAIAFAKKNASKYKSVNELSWGLTASDGPNGYTGAYGSAPSSGNAHKIDGTIAPCGALGSIVFTPNEAINAANNYRKYDLLWSKYGFVDAYNLGTQEGYVDESIAGKIPASGWFDSDIIGIDKGISVLMIENYISNFTWNIFSEIKYIQNGLSKLGFTKST
jgi:hypothetical protein